MLFSRSRSHSGPNRQQAAGLLCAVGAVSLFTGFTLLSRLGITTSSLSMADIALLRFAVAGTLMLPLLVRFGLGGLKLQHALLLALTGGVGFALFAYTGFSLAPASHGGALLHGTIPMFTALLGWMVSKVSPGRRAWSGLLLIQGGAIAVFLDASHGTTGAQKLGDLALLLAGASWAAYGLLCQRFRLNPLHTMALVAVGSLLCFLPLYALLPSAGFHGAHWRDILFQAVFQGVLIGIVSGLLYTRAVALLGATIPALSTAAVPCITAVAGIWLLDEHPSPLIWAGIACITLGMVVAMSSRRPASKAHDGHPAAKRSPAA